MIRQLRLADSHGRDATCGLLPVRLPDLRRWQDLAGQPVQMTRRVRATAVTHPETLLAQSPDPDDLAQALIAGDPEWDLRALGRPTGPCTRGYRLHGKRQDVVEAFGRDGYLDFQAPMIL